MAKFVGNGEGRAEAIVFIYGTTSWRITHSAKLCQSCEEKKAKLTH